MHSNPRMLTYENAPINTGIKPVYPELSQIGNFKGDTHEIFLILRPANDFTR